ncbi:MAG: response regulator [Synergistaceae bacterium]|jgi:putative two-component system response regulator|nr:response regulator [Synergistaceae bacterium]
MKRVLVVDDSIACLEQMNAQLSPVYDVMAARSGAIALQICTRYRPDLILLDIAMPDMDGFEVLSRLRSNPWLSSIPVIFLTSSEDSETEDRGLRLGARDFIVKSVDREILFHRVDLHLRFAEYQTNLENTVREISDSYALSFAEMIEYRDENTGGHVIRTGKYVWMLGRELLKMGLFSDELSEAGLEIMARAAPLHDIGKIAISDRILLKPARLTREEFEVMKTHAVIGADILANMYARMPTQSYLQYAEIIARSHHERVDGSGYPLGLRGGGIPLAGRIMALVDTYDALVEDRVYRRGMSHAEACRIILKGKGVLFDSDVVDAFEIIRGNMETEGRRWRSAGNTGSEIN